MKSKRWISLMLALMLCLSCLTAFAENSVIVKTDYNSANYVRAESACVVGDTVYMTGQSETAFGLYYWKKGMEAPVPLKSEKELIADTSIIFDDMSEEELAEQLALLEENGSDASHALGILFTDGERLLNMNTVTGLVCVVNVNEEIVTFDDVIQIADTNPLYHHEADYMYQSNRNGFAYAGNKLLVAIEDYDNNTGENINNIVIFDLETGKTTISAVPYVTGISNYRDGKAIVTILDWTTYYENPDVRPVLATYDPETDTVSEFATLSSTNIRGLGYLPAMDRIAYAANNRLMGISLKDGSEKQLGFYQGSFYSSSPLQAFGKIAC